MGAFEVEGEVPQLAPSSKKSEWTTELRRVASVGERRRYRPASVRKWIIDFATMSEVEAALYQAPFAHVVAKVKPERQRNRDVQRRTNWWRLGRSGADLKAACDPLNRIIVTPRVARYRLFAWASNRLLPDTRLVAIARDDDTSFGILHSRMHEIWTLRLGGWHGVGNDPQYTPSIGFETFPFLESEIGPDKPAADYAFNSSARDIAATAFRLNELREKWLNPADLVRPVPEVVTGYPDRILPIDDAAARELKKRTLTNLYNERPVWLEHAHRDLDRAVAKAYGWDDYEQGDSDDEILRRLLALNQERAADQAAN